MRIKVLAVADQGAPLVDRETSAGRLTAQWRSEEPAHPGETQDVELEAVGELVWGESVHVATGVPPLEGSNVLVGLVEAIDGESVTLRISDSLILLEVNP